MKSTVVVDGGVPLRGLAVPGALTAGGEDQGFVENRAEHVDFPALDGRRVGEDLETRPRGPRLVVGEVELATRPVVVVPADHCQYLARFRVHADQCGVVEVIEVAFLRDLVAHDLLRHVLQVQVEAGVDAVALAIVGRDAVGLLRERLQDVVDEVGRLEFRDRRENRQFDGIGSLGLGGRDVLFADHRGQHLCLPLLGRFEVDDRVVPRRCLRQPGEHGRLRQ